MGLIYQDNFQSYSLGANPPYGDLEFYASGGVSSTVVADPAGLFGQTQSINLPADTTLILPAPVFDNTGPFYQQASVFQYIKLLNTTDVRGVLVTFANAHTNIFGGQFVTVLSGVRILSDGTLAIVADLNGPFAPNTVVSDYSLLCSKWYLIRTDISFGSNLGNLQVLSCKVYVNGVVVVQCGITNTANALSEYSSLYFNDFQFLGAGQTLLMGGTSVYDTIQASNFYPNPATPSARLNQGIIELIKKRALPPSNTRIYEA